MIDGFRRRRATSPGLRPVDQHHAGKVVVGDHSGDHAPTSSQPMAAHTTPQPFTPPEAKAEIEEDRPETATVDNFQPPKPPEGEGKLAAMKAWFKGLSKKQWALIIIVAVLLIGGSAAAFLARHDSKPIGGVSIHTKPKKAAPAKPTTVASVTTGVQVDPAVNERAVTGVMIENSELARPQTGLNQADIIFEAVAEGGITRFLVMFHDNLAGSLGPVRSVRPYYIQWALGFDSSIAHVGGSPEALQDMKTWNAKDLDQFAYGDYFHRVASRYAPHNVYTSVPELNQIEAKRGYGKAKFTSLPRKAEEPSKAPNAKSISFVISSAAFNVHYDYDAATNSYKRFLGGAPHTVGDLGGAQTQLQPKVVVALIMPKGINSDGIHTTYGAVGSGHAYVFQDGTLTEGSWQKANNSAPIILTNAANQPLTLNPGQTWFTALGDVNSVTYSP
ncbi:MAG TPA: DUF3048 domain-containing protein [Candidatus Saccharimonadales bacterium]|nr:DUF3048 domain-containing protein [Candidatus Saccharimonadales bacterium]